MQHQNVLESCVKVAVVSDPAGHQSPNATPSLLPQQGRGEIRLKSSWCEVKPGRSLTNCYQRHSRLDTGKITLLLIRRVWQWETKTKIPFSHLFLSVGCCQGCSSLFPSHPPPVGLCFLFHTLLRGCTAPLRGWAVPRGGNWGSPALPSWGPCTPLSPCRGKITIPAATQTKADLCLS